jgi:mRNA interferase MazF
MEITQYQIILFCFDPTIGSEIKKTRPAVVVSPNEINLNLSTITVVPMTTNLKNYPTRVAVQFNETKGMMAIDQIRTIDKKRVIKVLGKLSSNEIKKCKDIIKQTFVD